jgi:sigma-B regulation protein RsbU (phosphoserine phosphatase)
MGASAGPQIPVQEALRIFNASQVYLCLGAGITMAGLLAAGYSVLRRRLDPLLAWFAVFAGLYGIRLMIHQQPMWQLGFHPPVLTRLLVGLGYLVPIPAFLFFRSLKMLTRIGDVLVFTVSPVLVVLCIVTLALGPLPVVATLDSLVVTVSLAIFAVELVRSRSGPSDIKLIHSGLVFFILCALYGNLTDYIHVPYYNIEPFAFVVLLAALGIVAGRRSLARDQQLTVMEKELQIARDIQLSILPGAFPPSRSFRVSARYVPMTSVAGDLYEFLLASDDEAGLLIADVSGHGVPAALIASMVKLAITSQRAHADDPAAVLKGMNETLCGNTQQQFVTAAYVYLNSQTRELRYAAAAHPPLLLLRNGEVSSIEENGLLLAAFDFATYTAITVPLMAGDRLLMYTDGLLEAANAAGEEFGTDRLCAALRSTAQRSAAEASEQIVATVHNWAAMQNDDLTVITCDFVG